MFSDTWVLALFAHKLLSYLAVSGSIGAAFLLQLPALAQPQSDSLAFRLWLKRLVLGWSAAGMVLALLYLPLQAGALAETGVAGMADRLMLQMVWQSAMRTQLLLWLCGYAALWLWARRVKHSGNAVAVNIALVSLAALLLAASFSQTGHVASLAGLWPLLLTLHVLAISAWVGSLLPLWQSCYRLAPDRLVALMGQFGQVALYLLVLLISCGVLILLQLLDSPSALFVTDYGRLMLFKLMLVAAMLLLAAWHKFSLVKALLQQGAAGKLQIKLAAPTGKAAVRLTESISGALSRLPAELTAAIPTEVATLHRLLGALPNRRSFKHHSDNPLQLDVLVVDEASMVDLEMMAALLSALPAKAQLILLGDKDQLSSVEAGSVLGDLCRGADLGCYSADTLALLTPYSELRLATWQGSGTVLNQATVMLRHSHRFDSKSGIGQLAAAVNCGDTKAPALFRRFDDITLLAGNTPLALKATVLAGYCHYLQLMQQPHIDREQWAGAVLGSYSQFQLLCALRSGDWGVEGLNLQISQWLSSAGLIDARQHWYAGRPVMMQRNNYSLGLMNGDIGITLQDPLSGQLRVVFQLSDGTLKWVLPSRLTEVDTAFAITVHKSQGSEFTHTVLVLPPQQSPILTRELLYTAITRAKQQFSLLCADMTVLQKAINTRVSRSSGL